MWHLAHFHCTLSHLVISYLKYLESLTQTFGNCSFLITRPSVPLSVSMTPFTSLPPPSFFPTIPQCSCISFQLASQKNKNKTKKGPIVIPRLEEAQFNHLCSTLACLTFRFKKKSSLRGSPLLCYRCGALNFLAGFSFERCRVKHNSSRDEYPNLGNYYERGSALITSVVFCVSAGF